MATHPKRVAGLDAVATPGVGGSPDFGNGDHDDEDQQRKANEQAQNLQGRRIRSRWPTRERFQRH